MAERSEVEYGCQDAADLDVESAAKRYHFLSIQIKAQNFIVAHLRTKMPQM
jgi:hypothetical protein